MAPESRTADYSLAHLLFGEAYRFDFFQAVRVLERLHPDRQPVGEDAKPGDEVVRFATRVSLAFPPSAIHELRAARDEGRPDAMVVAFLGLTGPLGVLPRHYTELLLERTRQKDFALRDFLDLFNHRLISLFYRAWEKYRFPLAYERARHRGDAPDRFTVDLFGLIGLATDGLRGRLAVVDEGLLLYAGLLGQRPHSASALEGLLADYFRVPVRIMQFVGEWLAIAPESQTQVGTANSLLGRSILAGSRVWDQQARFRVQLGPLRLAQYDAFLPSSDAFRPLVRITRFVVGLELGFDVQLVLRASEVPGCRLGATGLGAPRLGWTTWLQSRPFEHDAEDLVVRAETVPDIARPATSTTASPSERAAA